MYSKCLILNCPYPSGIVDHPTFPSLLIVVSIIVSSGWFHCFPTDIWIGSRHRKFCVWCCFGPPKAITWAGGHTDILIHVDTFPNMLPAANIPIWRLKVTHSVIVCGRKPEFQFLALQCFHQSVYLRALDL